MLMIQSLGFRVLGVPAPPRTRPCSAPACRERPSHFETLIIHKINSRKFTTQNDL
jgi:hypothetical protein